MSRRIRVPGIIDVIQLDDIGAIRELSEDARLDRRFEARGPLLNRVITGRVRESLRVGGHPLTAVTPRDDPGRADRQEALERRLGTAAPGTPEQRGTLAAYVRGETGDAALGPTVQAAIGELFAEGYSASNERWKAAETLNAAPRTINPFRRLYWGLTGAVRRAREALAAPVANDPSAVHATGIAVHNIVRGLGIMREIWRDEPHARSLPVDAVIARCTVAPESVLRQWKERASTVHGDVGPGVLTVFELDAARQRSPSAATVFMTESWSRCPAHDWTTRLLVAIWSDAVEGRTATAGDAGVESGAAP